MEAIEALKGRRSIRRYKDKEVKKEIIEDIIRCGGLAATGNNIQPCKFLVVTNKETRKIIKNMVPNGPFIDEAPVTIVVISEKTKYFLEDGSSATQNILIAAKAYDLGSCWVAGHKKEFDKDIKKLLNIPNEYELISLVTLGYPESQSNPRKKGLEEIICWETYK